MFYNAYAFNQDISKWNVFKVKDMSSMLNGASKFNFDISKWNVGNETKMDNALRNTFSLRKDRELVCELWYGDKKWGNIERTGLPEPSSIEKIL